MGIQYDPSDFEMPWRRNYELMAAATWLTGAAGYSGYAAFGSFPAGPLLWIAGGMTAFGLFKLRKGLRLMRLQHRLAGTPLPLCTFDDLQRICRDPAHQGEIWLGKGFLWGPTHTQRIMDILRRDWQQIVKDALGPFFLWRFAKKNAKLAFSHPLKARHLYLEQQKSLNDKGQPWIHGVGGGEENVFQPISHAEGHTLVIGTTGAGKTRCFDLLISQAILRGECVIIIDPKGDADLKNKAQRACEALGRKNAFVMFHPAKTEESAHINLLANWTRPTELASRIANLIQSTGQSDPFKNFSWDALNKVAQGLCIAYEKPSIMNLRRYLESSPEELFEKAFSRHLLHAYGESGERIIEKLYASCKRNSIENRVTALINYYLEHGPSDPALDGLISLRNHDKEHFGKMVTSLLPILSQLTSGKLGRLLSPPEDPDEQGTAIFRDTGDFIEKNSVVYMGLDSLSDNMVGSAIGSLMLADLTAAALFGHYQGVDIIIPHCWFPLAAAAVKAHEDNIPLFGWQEDGWLDMSNDKVTNHSDVVRWYKDMRQAGFQIRRVGHDRKFCREYFLEMKQAHFKIKDQPQLFTRKSEGLRYLENSAKKGTLYYLHAEPFEYCVQNVRGVEKADDMVMYDKLQPNLRIDVFDAAVFACCAYLEDLEQVQKEKNWFGEGSEHE